jgi:hypothetical protein
MLSVMLGRTSRTATGRKCLFLGWGSVLAYELFKLLTPTAKVAWSVRIFEEVSLGAIGNKSASPKSEPASGWSRSPYSPKCVE